MSSKLMSHGFFAACLALLNAGACLAPRQGVHPGPPEKSPLPVRLLSGFQLSNQLLEPPASTKVSNLKTLGSAAWESPIDVTLGRTNERGQVGSCDQYFALGIPGVQPLAPSEFSLYRGLTLMCEAAGSLALAVPSRQSFLNSFKLNQASPRELPKQFALAVSAEEKQRIVDDPALRVWADVNDITEFVFQTADRALYRQNQAEQVVELVGRGDLDGDGVEDILVLVSDSLSGGTYRSLRLLAITRLTRDEDITLLREFAPLWPAGKHLDR